MGKRILGENYYIGKDEQESDNTPNKITLFVFQMSQLCQKDQTD